MDHNMIFGGNPMGVIIRLLIVSLVVGIVLSALGITPDNLFYQLNILAGRLYELGFGWVEWALRYVILGAMVVVPVWLIARAVGLVQGRNGATQDDGK